MTKTSSQLIAAEESGAACSRVSLAGATELVELAVELDAAFAALATVTPTPLATAGTPVDVPPAVMLLRPATEAAAMLRLPAAPIPASPALTVRF